MDLRKLRHAVVLARFLNFTKAAQALNLTQSALSRSIQALEDECQVRLFDRTRNMVAVTAVGRDFLRLAADMLQSEAEMIDMVSHAAKGNGGTIALGMAPLAARALMAPLLIEMIDRPGFQSNIAIGAPKRLFAMLVSEEIELCVCTGRSMAASAPYTSTILARFTLGFIVRAGHPIIGIRDFAPGDLRDFPILQTRSFEQNSDASLISQSLSLNQPALTIQDYKILMEVTANSDAVWLTSPIAAHEGLGDGTLVFVPIGWIEDPPETIMTLHELKHRTLSPLAQNARERIVGLSKGLGNFAADRA